MSDCVAAAASNGAGERLYSDGVFLTEPELCEEYGHDIVVGNQLSEGGVPRVESAGSWRF